MKIDYRDIDKAIMDFQIHVRETTGGNDYAMVDMTNLKKAIKQSHIRLMEELIAKEEYFRQGHYHTKWNEAKKASITYLKSMITSLKEVK